ncbi:MAG: sugar kinase [Armatimonadota bacterium]
MLTNSSPSPPETTKNVLTFGEVLLRLAPPSGLRLSQTSTLDVWVAGSEANVAAGLRALGVPATWVGRLPDNAVGHRALRGLAALNIDVRHIVWTDTKERVGLLYTEPGAPPRPPTAVYDRAGSAAAGMIPSDISDDLLIAHQHLHVSGITPALSENCAHTVRDAVRRARAHGRTVSLDVNWRAMLWTAETARATLADLLPLVDIVICSQPDAQRVFGLEGTAEQMVQALRERYRVPVAVLTTGADGAVGCDGDKCLVVPAVPIEKTIERIGSGDAFAAGFLAGYLNRSLEEGLQLGVAAAAFKRTVPGDMLIGTRREIEALRASEDKPWR